ncbi:lytic transglycosylase domain-containing protein [Breoghania sp. L-A4]|uniref:lytic transglycosylase domain-containing protein n=1 Tax=Breoghania sp. L-A4 TaxID=2304600 RepID=UPI000E360834|nr:lytic transglycosylase domain-containing protein [Breoghania sp. L-A4]AXS41338.1 lytic transglycosylase domain-containing protein [Breoghania sp. L-A4]
MFRSFQVLLACALFLATPVFAGLTTSQAASLVHNDATSPLAVLRAHIARTGDASGAEQAVAKKEKPVNARRKKLSVLVMQIAKKHGVPTALANAVVTVESNYNPGVRGGAGEVGLMQIKPATARGMGYRGGTKALYQPQVNLEWGMRYLAEAHRLAGGDVCGTILRYNAGHYARRMNPISKRYCSKVMRILG